MLEQILKPISAQMCVGDGTAIFLVFVSVRVLTLDFHLKFDPKILVKFVLKNSFKILSLLLVFFCEKSHLTKKIFKINKW